MFNKLISQTPLTTEEADGFFNIRSNDFQSDVSFSATMRALLHSRIKNNDPIGMLYTFSSYDPAVITSSPANVVFNGLLGYHLDTTANTLYIHNLRAADNSESIKLFQQKFCSEFSPFRELPDLRQFVSKYMNALFFIDETNKRTVIVVEHMDLRKYHLLQSMLPRYFPWLFSEQPITDDERNLLTSLTNRYAVEYERLIAEAAARIDIRSYSIRRLLRGLAQTSRTEQRNQVSRNINDVRETLARLMREYDSYLGRLDEYNVRLAGLDALINAGSDDSELIDFFICNRSLTNLSVYSGGISFIVQCYLDSFDPDMYETMSRNVNSHLYNGYSHPAAFNNIDAKKLFLDAIFGSEPKLKVKVCAIYSLSLNGSVTSHSHYSYPRDCADRIPNPHLQYHNCLGNHQRHIRQALLDGDTVRAVAQCIASAKSLNVGESATAQRFFGQLMNATNNIFELPDGTCCNAEAALRWLQQQNSNEEDSHVETDSAD